ncbi:MAG: AI-2E family transporter [Oscillospiraceae bacterium]|nr:AI-2E family transporter [Oscillospiraceae bacterium]MBR2636292.1 AI-2E family transporter [Oscillospiraceae bacterium]MBR6607817.1 AI-2E family transporter [Oscillospiraceae bacterium]
MKVEWNKKYTTIAVYTILVAVACMICYNLLHNFSSVKAAIGLVFTTIMPVIYGFSIAFIINPIVVFFEKNLFNRFWKDKLARKWRKGLSVLLAYLVSVLVIGLFLYVVIPQVVASVSGIASNFKTYVKDVNTWLTALFAQLPQEAFVQQIIDQIKYATQTLVEAFYEWLSTALPLVFNATVNLTTGVTNLVLGIIISVYFLYSKERFLAQLKKVLYAFFPKDNVKKLISITHTSNRIFTGFISGKLLDSLIIGVLCFIGMSIFNLPMAMLVSVIVGVTNVIPYFGPFIGAIPGALIVFLVDPIKAFWFLLFILALQQFDGNILGPYILGDSIGLPAFWVIFAILVFGSIFGVLGMFIGVPTFAVIYSIIKMWIESRLEKKGMPLSLHEYASEEHPLD